MAEKKIQENPLPEEQQTESMEKPKEMQNKTMPDKVVPPTPAPVLVPPPTLVMPAFRKTSPNDLYRKLLPAVLFLLTFVTVMTILLIYMDTVAAGAQQFHLNLSREHELPIPQESAALVSYVRQLHLAPRPVRAPPAPPAPTARVRALDRLYGPLYNGTFVEFVPRGARDPTTLYLESARGWAGVAVRSSAPDYLALRAAVGGRLTALHACLSPAARPREVPVVEGDSGSGVVPARVLCLPLYTVLAAARAPSAHYVALGGPHVAAQLTHLPFDRVHLQVIDHRSSDPLALSQSGTFLATKNYSVAAVFEDGVMYALNSPPLSPPLSSSIPPAV